MAEFGSDRLEHGRQNELSDIINQIAGRYPDSFAGAENHHGSFVVHTASPGSDMERALLSASALRDVEIRFVPADRTPRQLYAVTQAISKASGWLRRQKIPLVAWGPDIAGNTVVVHLERPTPAAQEVLAGRFGRVVVVAEETMRPPGQY